MIRSNDGKDGRNLTKTIAKPRICTFTGHLFNPLEPTVDDINIIDIGHALGNIARYNGHTKHFLSVAQHSVLVAAYVSPENRGWGLLHDASEAYIGDIVHPLKVTADFDFYCEVEDRLMEVIAEKFGLDPVMSPEVKEYDLIVRATEMRDVSSIPEELWGDIPPLDVKITPWNPELAKTVFLDTYEEIFDVDLQEELGDDAYYSYLYPNL